MEKDLTNIAADIFGNDFEEGTKLMHETWQN
jgi:O-acetyl-ADP-ribose deacetylase (regulator of RNase III)